MAKRSPSTDLVPASHVGAAEIQIVGSADSFATSAILQAQVVREVDEAQLRVLVYETKKALTARINAETDTLVALEATLADRRKALEEAVDATDVAGAQGKLAAVIAALVDAGFGAAGIVAKATVEGRDADDGTIRIKSAIRFDAYSERAVVAKVAEPAAVAAAAAAAGAAQHDRDSQHAAVAAIRAELANTAKIEETGRYAIDRRLIGASSDAAARAAVIDGLVSGLLVDAEARVTKARAGVRKLDAPRKKAK